jgi:hypothetical protein
MAKVLRDFYATFKFIRLSAIMRVWGRRKTEDGREGIDEEKELRKLPAGEFLYDKVTFGED